MKKAYIFLAEGFEEIEALTPCDLLKRSGIDVKFVSISNKKEVTGSHDITIIADLIFENQQLNDGDCYILPGGMPGTKNLNEHKDLKDLILKQYENEKLIAGICAAPMILSEIGILDDKDATIYPTMKEKIKNYVSKNVCISQNVITANALASSIDFSLAIVKEMLSENESNCLKNEIVY